MPDDVEVKQKRTTTSKEPEKREGAEMVVRCCATCKWWVQLEPPEETAKYWVGSEWIDESGKFKFGECRGAPPTALNSNRTLTSPKNAAITAQLKQARWAHTFPDPRDWCAMWKNRNEN